MAVTPRQVKNKRDSNGKSTGRAGTVYDVNVKYRTSEGYKAHVKRGFATRQLAEQYEARMRTQLATPFASPASGQHSKVTVHDFLNFWMERHEKNLRPATQASYRSQIKSHILPLIGHVYLADVTPEMLDGFFQHLFDEGLATGSVAIVRNILNVSMDTARKYHYINQNPVQDTMTRFPQNARTPEPYTLQQVHDLLEAVLGTSFEMPVMLAVMYGLRLSECVGMRWSNVDLANRTFEVIEQMPYNIPTGTLLVKSMAPLKSDGRVLPVTASAMPVFERQLSMQQEQRRQIEADGGIYYDNHLVFAHKNGCPLGQVGVSQHFGRLIKWLHLPRIRFHDLRHTAATNMYQLTGDFYTVGKILGHSLKGVGTQLGISNNLHAVTERYVDVRLERIKMVIEAYHNALDLDTSELKHLEKAPKHQRERKKTMER